VSQMGSEYMPMGYFAIIHVILVLLLSTQSSSAQFGTYWSALDPNLEQEFLQSYQSFCSFTADSNLLWTYEGVLISP